MVRKSRFNVCVYCCLLSSLRAIEAWHTARSRFLIKTRYINSLLLLLLYSSAVHT